MRIWEFAVHRWQFTLIIFTLLAALGVSTLLTIPRSEDPTFPFPSVTLTIVYPGATPADIERLVIKPIEDGINSLDNVKKIDSSAFDGLASIHTEFYYGGDPEKKQDEVIRELDRLRPTLPSELTHIDISKDNPGNVNIALIALVSDTASYQELDRLARGLKDSIETVPGVRRAEVWALPKPEVRISVDLERLAAQANDSIFGLAASVWTRDISAAHKMARRIKAGTVWVNCHNVFDAALPFGGYKQSGWGREMGAEVLNNYTEVKAVTIKL